MATTADYLNKLVEQKNTLADNLVTKGVTATHNETLETLVPKVLDISGGETEYAEGIVKEYNDFNNLKWVEIKQHNDNSFIFDVSNTIECCFSYSELNSTLKARICELDSISNAELFQLNMNEYCFEFTLDGAKNWYTPTKSDIKYLIPEYKFSANILYTISVVMDESETTIYINGSLFVTVSSTIASGNTIKNIALKYSQRISSRDLIGRIYDLRMYNRALSESEIEHNRQTDIKRYGET